MFRVLVDRKTDRDMCDRSCRRPDNRPIGIVNVAVTPLKQIKLALFSKRKGVVSHRCQLPALWFLEEARTLDAIERKEAAMVLEPLARLGARIPDALAWVPSYPHWCRNHVAGTSEPIRLGPLAGASSRDARSHS